MYGCSRWLLCGLMSFLIVLQTQADTAWQGSDAQATSQRALDFLRSTQNADGSWTPQPGPAITGLVLTAMLEEPSDGGDVRQRNAKTPATQKAVRYILSRAQPDGSIRDGINGPLANYNTAICLSALSKLPTNMKPTREIKNAQRFLKGLQWQEGMKDPDGKPITKAHAFYGGAGYGNHGRPDLSNTQFMLQALHDSGIEPDDPAFRRALVFIGRCANVESNDFYPDGALANDGGMIYATSIDRQLVGVPESKANPEMIDEAKAGRPVSGLRSYGSMTYAGFKSYLYANLRHDDPRVLAALGWLRENYTLDQNPGMPEGYQQHGLYYYYLAMARALDAWGSGLELSDATVVPWREELARKLAQLQREDGSFMNDADRWMEGDANLVTAYALIALHTSWQAER